MGTRGAYGFIKKGEMKITYNHYDSYLSGLGFDIMKFIAETTDEELNKICDNIIMVEEDTIPTKEQITECEKYLDLKVGKQEKTDWYCLLRNAQGNLSEYKKGLRYMIDNKEFMANSLFCEYGYVINLDTNMLEIYKGFNKNPNTNNVFSQFRQVDNDNMGYVEVRLFEEIDFNTIRKLFTNEDEKVQKMLDDIETDENNTYTIKDLAKKI